MFSVVETGLAKSESAPVTTAVKAGGFVFTAQVPKDEKGDIIPGDICVQTRKVMDNLKQTIEAAGGTMKDIVQVEVYLCDSKDFQTMNEVYASYFEKPYPNRATIGVKELMHPLMKVEMRVIAYIGK